MRRRERGGHRSYHRRAWKWAGWQENWGGKRNGLTVPLRQARLPGAARIIVDLGSSLQDYPDRLTGYLFVWAVLATSGALKIQREKFLLTQAPFLPDLVSLETEAQDAPRRIRPGPRLIGSPGQGEDSYSHTEHEQVPTLRRLRLQLTKLPAQE